MPRPEHNRSKLASHLGSVSTSWRVSRVHDHSQRPSCRTQSQSPQFRRSMSAADRNAAEQSHVTSVQSLGHSEAEAPIAEDLVQYLVLRKDLWNTLEWPLGSIIAQACHASTAALWLSKDSPVATAYCAAQNLDHMHKVWESLNTAAVGWLQASENRFDKCCAPEGSAGSQGRTTASHFVQKADREQGCAQALD